MKIYISGGAKNGKSLYAQRLAKALAGGDALYYLATMDPHDREDDARVARHREARAGWGFQTLEWPQALGAHLGEADPSGTYLLDSVTALLANEMFTPQGVDRNAFQRVSRDLTAFAGRVGNFIAVSDFIVSDAGDYDELTEHYRRSLSAVDRACAEAFDSVLEISSGTATARKGELPL